MNDLEYHSTFVDIFKHLRDQNAEYHIPGSHACITAFIGINLIIVDRFVFVSAVEPNELWPGLNSVHVGDNSEY